MAFFNICPRNKKYLDYAFKDIPLRVIYNNGVTVTPDFDVNVTDLNNGYKHFKVNNGKGDTFKLQVLIHRKDTVQGRYNKVAGIKDIITIENRGWDLSDFDFDRIGNVNWNKAGLKDFKWKTTDLRRFSLSIVLNYFMRTLTPFMVTSDIMGINQNVPYIITKNSSRKQSYHDYSIWELEFTRYDKLTYSNFTKQNTGIKNALKKAKQKNKKVSAKTKERLKLRKCKWRTLKYSKTKKVIPCVKVLQKILNLDLGTKLKLDGWFGKETYNAMKKYQKKYSKTYGLKQTGHMNLSTYNVMIGKAKPLRTSRVTPPKKTTTKTKTNFGKLTKVK